MPCITQRQKEFGSNVNTDIPGIQLQHETPIFQNLAPTWDADIPEFNSNEFSFNVDADIPDKNSAQMWTPIFQEFGSGMDTEFQDKISVSAWILNPKGILAPTWILKSQRKIGSYLDTESQRLPKIRKPKFVLTFGSWALDIWVLTFGSWALDIWISTFGWTLDIWALNIWVLTFGSWILDRFHFEFFVGFLFRTSIEWVSLSDFCQIKIFVYIITVFPDEDYIRVLAKGILGYSELGFGLLGEAE
ncbi:hypothetical protein RhiirA1_470855 [Rhizophagus irregularis]|uniref:Uncharacterized protein n=1 Tax=Rhizophagus irregularis TaxID=588596 RepID=A0A2N0R5B1_9GLOM|nr:hypothetical protein RhiirA1_470855 [Rhizophagus irregularis]